MPIPNLFWEAVPDADSFLVSYPRSGSRWMMMLLTDVEFSANGRDSMPIYDHRFRREIAESKNKPSTEVVNVCFDVYGLTAASLSEVLQKEKPRMFRAHSYTGVLARDWTKCVYIFRQPDRMLLSYIYYARARGYLSEDTEETFAFSRGRLAEWIRSVSGAVEHALNTPDRFRLIAYREGEPFSESCLLTAMNTCGLGEHAGLAGAACSRFRAMLKKLNDSSRFDYPRGGYSGEMTDDKVWSGLEPGLREEAESAYARAKVAISESRQ